MIYRYIDGLRASFNGHGDSVVPNSNHRARHDCTHLGLYAPQSAPRAEGYRVAARGSQGAQKTINMFREQTALPRMQVFTRTALIIPREPRG